MKQSAISILERPEVAAQRGGWRERCEDTCQEASAVIQIEMALAACSEGGPERAWC